MLSSMRVILILTIIGLLAILGCDDDSATVPDKETGDTIIINSVTPDSGIKADIEASFVVAVEYQLVSADLGEINIGFNSAEVGRYHILKAATVLVDKGSGEHQFNVTVVPKDWGSDGDFSVYVNLSEQAHESVWTPIATDIRVLTLQ